MARLALLLPPFSPDYSGAGAVLFDLNTVTVIHDGGGCSGNYAMHDEPRWYGSSSGIYSSALREMDVIMGNDEKLLQKMEQTAQKMHPDLMAIISSPVPALIGTDVSGIALEAEERTGIPCLGIPANGVDYYDKGAFRAAQALIDRFSIPGLSPRKGRVNILGVTPMDFGLGGEIRELKQALQTRGYDIGLSFAMDYNLEQVRRIAEAQVNLAVSSFGYAVARYLEKRFHMPYLCGFPVGEDGEKQYFGLLEEVAATGHSRVWGADERTEKERSGSGKVPLTGSCEGAETLIIGEQVMSGSIRAALKRIHPDMSIRVGGLFDWKKELAWPEDIHLAKERAIRLAMKEPSLRMIVADPLLQPLSDGNLFCAYPHYAVSGKLMLDRHLSLLGKGFEKVLEMWGI